MKKMINGLLAAAVPLALTAVLAVPVAIPTQANAQSYRDYCHDRARRLSGYNGRGSDVAGGAIEGAIKGAILSGILGGDKDDRRRAAGAGAVLGGISGANRPNSRAARIYRLEFEECMRRR